MYGDPRRSLRITRSAQVIALIAIGSWFSITIPFLPVPFTLQTLFVLLAGALLKRYAVLPVGLYILLGTLGLPLFHHGLAGPGILLGPTGGYIAGFLGAAAVVGIAYEQTSPLLRGAGMTCGALLILAAGSLWLMASSPGLTLAGAFVIGFLPFLPGDILKAAAAYTIAGRLA
ncbi:MAG: biotin transporter BioY [Methanomicrobiaceae archaeon]|nr:biotin transporter BioY [Methanomicrobiaceae archaeon]